MRSHRPRTLRALEAACRRNAGVAVGSLVLVSMASGCGGGAAAQPEAAREVVASTTTVATSPSTTTTPPVTTTTLRPLQSDEVLVADVRADIGELEVHDSPGGPTYVPELPLVNPWYFGGQLSVLVTQGREVDEWVEVQLPGRPNDTRKWIRSADVTFRAHRFRITVDLGERVLRAFDAGTQVFETPVVVGRTSTPTPLGRFFVNAHIPQKNPAGAYGPVILSVSAFSEVLDSFDGGLPEIALHGTNQPGLVGQAVSNGCIRMPNDAITKLASIVPVGTPVEFVA